MENPVLHLASSSPRRRQILTALGVRFSFAGVGIDESRAPQEEVADMAVRLAREKAQAAIAGDLPVLGADTIVALDERIFGKPESQTDGIEMLLSLSGRTHQVFTGVACISAGNISTTVAATEVRFRDIHPDEAQAYWQSGEPDGKAGGYAVQGIGGIFVESLTGSYSAVVGLPVYETAKLLGNAGIAILDHADAK
jgi:septum formation protein